ncbi:AAA family ATPase [Virgibacillus sp. SK37]|uniref:AAA family ATPase n=1 Tax=Virgibacillus sp. SK37 TaxID=403957 RepID=UPI0004D0FBE1|nr:SMC family ATPase [Virgibacillus sp. SK37]AIF44311.1 exonuclease [Virgibacillus sp. SK37]
MKPLKLTMTAFGPYKRTEIVDFNELEDNRLFVISGNTGAGKTTIFDAICFALYGSASGQDRENTLMLRSDFAEDDTHTAVELLFELKGRYYRVLRQLGHVKKGNKSKTGDRFEFYEQVEEREIPCVDRQIVSEIDKKIEMLIGLTQDQFKQIVMLPQGEFRKLLTSQTENKEEILRRLFKTQTYQHISERLRIRKSKVEEAYNKAVQTRDTYIQHISATLPFREDAQLFQVLGEAHFNENQVVAGLEKEIEFYEERIKQDEETYEQAYKLHAQKQVEFSRAEAINKQWEELSDKEAQWKELQEKAPQYEEKENKLQQAERATHIYPYEKQRVDLKRDYQQKEQTLQQAQNAEQIAAKKVEESLASFQKEEGNQGEREALRKKLDQLYEFLPIVQEIDQTKRLLQQQKQDGKQIAEKIKEATAKHQQYKNKRDSYRNEIKVLDQSPNELVKKNNQRNEMLNQYKLVEEFIETKNKQVKLEEEVQQKQTNYEMRKKKYEKIENTWLNGQASILASHLHEGEACPVCGSEHHPNKAADEEASVTKEELENARKELEKIDEIYRTSVADWKAVKAQYEKRAADLSEINIPVNEAEEAKETILQQGRQLKKDIINLEAATEKVKQLKEELEKTEQHIEQVTEQEEKLEKQYQELNEKYNTTYAVYQERIGKIPEQIRQLSELRQAITEAEKKKEKMEEAWDKVQRELQKAKEEQTKVNTDLIHATNQLEETKRKQLDAEREWNNALDQAGFIDTKAYEEAKMSEIARKEAKREIEEYKQKRVTLQYRVDELKAALKDKKQLDLSLLEAQLQELKSAYETALKTVQQTKEWYKEAQQLKENILKSNEQVRKIDQQLGTVSDLFNVVRGQNDRKISFERYLQIEYLEQIIDVANQRLRRLSNGQFQLIRSDRQESHGRQSGLALDVYDAYTGQTRDVKSLSGGEKFNASLCLALGMSDVIQSFQGNITIDTMFIDEGFGTLDEESLNKAIDTLVDLQQSGRMIGVISHVQELKAIFPAILEVKKTKEGSSETAFVLK